MEHTDMRFRTPLYTVTEAARYLNVPRATLGTWVDGYVRGTAARPVIGQPLIEALPPERRGWPRLPFIGFAEAYVLRAFRETHVPLQRIRASLAALTEEVGPHALAKQDLRTDGAEILWSVADKAGEGEEVRKLLVVPRSGQIVFNEVVQQYLKEITFEDSYASRIRLAKYEGTNIVLDPRRGMGKPLFDRAGVTLEAVLGRIGAGEDPAVTAEDYGLPLTEVRAALALSA